MDNLQKFVSQVRHRLLTLLLINNLVFLVDWWLADQVFKLGGWWLIGAMFIAPILSVSFLPILIASALTRPTKLIWQAILHIAPDTAGVPAPDVKSARLGRELVANLVAHVYQLASVADNVEKLTQAKVPDLRADFIANNLPLPLLVLDKDDQILFANDALLRYTGHAANEVMGKDLASVLDLSFASENTLEAWLASAKKNTVTAGQNWERVRLNRPEDSALQFDLAAYYNKANPEHIETILVLFDHTAQYAHDDQAMSYVALAVHELRTPLTLMRGYIEALDEELEGKLSGDTLGFLQKMNAASQQLAAFVNNILNVARIEGDELELQLQSENWTEIVQTSVEALRLRASLRGIEITCNLPDNLPPVGVDRVSISEVISNLVDNAIKYSAGAQKKNIIVSAQLTADGLVETTVQDFGMGIPESIVPNLFTKFYRNHRNRAQIGGTGLGLYLSKSIVSAHGGNIWVRSKEGEGATFGFTVLPFARLADEQKTSERQGITRVAHGWIKNHSLYRR